MIYGSLDKGMTDKKFSPPNNLENQNFEKMKKKSGDAIILHMCTKNHDHDVCFLRYGVRQT